MLSTTLYFLLAFVLFIAFIAGIQKWVKLPQQKKDSVGLIVLTIFLISLLLFILMVIFIPTYFSADSTILASILFFFLFILFTVFFIKWYNDKYNKKINIGTVIIAFSLTFFGAVFLVLKFGMNTEKENIIKNVALSTTVKNISFDTHKPYFKDMTLAEGQYLPMPEAMNNEIQIGDSIYKIKGDNFYSVVSFKAKIKKQYFVATHLRVFSKPK